MNNTEPTRKSQDRWHAWLKSAEGRCWLQNANWLLLQREIATRKERAERRAAMWEVFGLIALALSAGIMVVLAMAW